MQLTRLRMHGFKSFVDATDIVVQPGLTGVVGPNGCGKSNLVEALRFVMGESSYKAMRGGGMDDVIFSGAADRPARNMAEVTLLLEQERPGGQGVEQIEVIRRIERAAGSTYRLNGREVRARDVQLLFADAATGAHSSALVRQGQVAELIAAKPEQRRRILEDAAGIAGLHSRRGEAEAKLKAAEANIERLDDIMREIGDRLEGLRRQARQAIRYRKLSDEIRKAEATLFAVQWDAAIRRQTEAEAALSAAKAAFAAAAGEQAEAAKQEAVAAARLPELREAAISTAAAFQRIRQAEADLGREEARLKARAEDLVARRAQAAADLEHQAEIDSHEKAGLELLDIEEAELRRLSGQAAERIAGARAAAEAAAAQVTATEAAFAAAAEALAVATAERAGRERAMREAQAKLRRLDEERKAVLKQRDRLHAEHGGNASLKAAASALAHSEAFLAERETESQAAQAAISHAHETERRARTPYETAERNLSALQAEARTLAELLDLDGSKRFPPLIDSLEVAPGYEQALVAALGDDLEASLDPEAPAHWGASGLGTTDSSLPHDVPLLADFVKAPENLGRRLRQIGIVDEARAAALLAGLLPGQRLVSRAGHLWRWDGLQARPGSAGAGAKRLEQRNRVAVLVSELRAARQVVEKAADLFETAKQVRADAERLDADGRGAVKEARKIVDERRVSLSEAERRASRIAERLSAFAGALARIEADTDASRADLRTATAALETLADTTELERSRNALQAGLAAHRGKAAELRLEAEKAAYEDTTRSRRAAELRGERERSTTRVGMARERAAELTARLAKLDAEIQGLADSPISFAERRRDLLGELSAAETAAASATARLAEAEEEHRQAGQVARATLEALSLARETRARDEERVISASARRDELAAQIGEQFGRPVSELRAFAGLQADSAELDPAGIETRLHRLKTERDRLGGVNLRAEEEASEIEVRLNLMRSEREDVEAAIKSLRQAIQNLNREGRERLLTAFEVVNGHFGSLFQSLFGGGTAELTLTGSDDPLEAGLDIVARPPGKRPHTMTLLSGGEQALTALSLIFAVFLTNPSPICVLDEVDAPLDDANVERFCNLLDEMRGRTDTRFVVVTHNPITMARMDRLYGVTMAERGVSQVVSVDLQAAELFREAS